MTQVADSTVEWIHVSLRDYFAAAALQGWIACLGKRHEVAFTTAHFVAAAQESFSFADAMLAERDKSKA